MNKLISKTARAQFKNISGIYYLIYKEQILYIGQSKNIQHRLTQHANPNNIQNTLKRIESEKGQFANRFKELSLYRFIEQHREDIEFKVEAYAIELLNEKEEAEITRVKPPYNYGGVDIPFSSVVRK